MQKICINCGFPQLPSIEEKMKEETKSASVGNVEPASLRSMLGPNHEDSIDSAAWGTEED